MATSDGVDQLHTYQYIQERLLQQQQWSPRCWLCLEADWVITYQWRLWLWRNPIIVTSFRQTFPSAVCDAATSLQIKASYVAGDVVFCLWYSSQHEVKIMLCDSSLHRNAFHSRPVSSLHLDLGFALIELCNHEPVTRWRCFPITLRHDMDVYRWYGVMP